MNSPFSPSSSQANHAARRPRLLVKYDLTWGRPVFHPPALPNPLILLDQSPYFVRSVTQPGPRAADR